MQSSLTSPVMPHHAHHPHHPQHPQQAALSHQHHPLLQQLQQQPHPTSPETAHQQQAFIDPGMPGPSITPVRKKGGRGPGKRENRDKPVVSVRWEEGDLTDRLISALELNERWAAVFAQAGPDQARAVIGVPKRDLQREIARFLFQNDHRYELDDKKQVEALAVSVKNKLFKIQNLFSECRHELGPYISNLKDESEIPADSEAWARVKDKFPQFFRVRDLIARSPVPLSAAASSRHDHEASPSIVGEAPAGPSTRPRTSSVSNAPVVSTNGGPTGAGGGGSVRPLNLATGQMIPYLEATQTSSPHELQATSQYRFQTAAVPPPRAYIPNTTYSPSAHATELQHPTPQQANPVSTINLRSSPPPRFQAFSLSPSPPPPPVSPPLATTLTTILTQFETRKRHRDEQYLSLKRAKIEERERVRESHERERQRWHEREMMRLKIRLARAERGEDVDVFGAVRDGAGREPVEDHHNDPGEDLGVVGPGVGVGMGLGPEGPPGMGMAPGVGHSHGSGTVSVNDPVGHAGNGTTQH